MNKFQSGILISIIAFVVVSCSKDKQTPLSGCCEKPGIDENVGNGHGLYFRIGGLPKGKYPKTSGPHHTPEFLLDDSAFKTGVNALCNLVFDYMEMHRK